MFHDQSASINNSHYRKLDTRQKRAISCYYSQSQAAKTTLCFHSFYLSFKIYRRTVCPVFLFHTHSLILFFKCQEHSFPGSIMNNKHFMYCGWNGKQKSSQKILIYGSYDNFNLSSWHHVHAPKLYFLPSLLHLLKSKAETSLEVSLSRQNQFCY